MLKMFFILLGIGSLLSAMWAIRKIICGALGLYRVVPVNEAHIRVMDGKKKIFCSREGFVSEYWFIPFITKLHKLPLCNLSIPVADIKLNDKEMAKFICDLVCFINIKELPVAVERLHLTDTAKGMGFDEQRLAEEFRVIMESTGRTAAAKHSILDIYMNRQALDEAITSEVSKVFIKWGIELVNLELKDIKDAPNSTIIADIERKVAADKKRDADIRIAETNRDAEIKKAEAEEAYRKRQIEKDQAIGIAQAEANIKIQERQAEANMKKVEAQRKIDVGAAEIERDVVEQESAAEKIRIQLSAEAQKIKSQTEAEGKALEITSLAAANQKRQEAEAAGNLAVQKANAEGSFANQKANADGVLAMKSAEAEGVQKLAEAMAKYDNTAVTIKLIDLQDAIYKGKFEALKSVGANAKINWIQGGDSAQKFFGMDLSGEAGAQLGQFIQTLGIDMTKLPDTIKKLIPKGGVVDTK